MQRHERNVHKQDPFTKPTPLVSGPVALHHPFTCIVAGCTQSGKTLWVKTLLENAQQTIRLPPQRIIWCYGQWQPMYLEMIDTIPGIEFFEGIPSEIDSRDFLDVNKRNLIVLDDLMAQSGGDKRIANLFTKGSHHRNLSVIYIVQNIFHQGTETRNISLNTHYIVLFKSPRDKQQILTLARQINPGRVPEFMHAYEKATSHPHGYLMLDLKPTTYDHHRLKTNVLPGERDGLQQQLSGYMRKQSYRQPPILNAMYNTEQEMENILSAPSMTPDEKSTLYSNEYHRFQTFKNQLQSKFQSLEDQLTGFIKKATKSIEEAKNKPQSSQLHADVEYSDEDDIVQVDAEDSDPDVAAQSSESEAEHSNIDVGEEEHEGHSPMPHYLTPPRTIEHPIKHWHTYDTDTENSSPGESDDESVADKGDSGDEQLEQPHFEQADVQMPPAHKQTQKTLGRYYLRNVRQKPY